MVSGRSKQASKHTHTRAQCSHASVGLAQARPNDCHKMRHHTHPLISHTPSHITHTPSYITHTLSHHTLSHITLSHHTPSHMTHSHTSHTFSHHTHTSHISHTPSYIIHTPSHITHTPSYITHPLHHTDTPSSILHLHTQDYFNIIKQPIDLSTISNRLESGKYKTPWEVRVAGFKIV